MRIIALMATYNEADRYLVKALQWLKKQVDIVFVYDDRSTDGTIDIAYEYADVVVPRSPGRTSFMQHEGRFRTEALHSLESVVHLHEDDWIFIADADEFFVPNPLDLRQILAKQDAHIEAVRIRIHSVWDQDNTGLYHRTDQAWDTLYEPRLWKWRPDLAFADKSMACRNEPVFFTMNGQLVGTSQEHTRSAILHYGYASRADRARRFKRYTELADHGHSPTFIESIVDEGSAYVQAWDGGVPCDVLS